MKNVLNKEELISTFLNIPQEEKDRLLLQAFSSEDMSRFLGYKMDWNGDIFYIVEPYTFPEKIELRGVEMSLHYIHDNVSTYYNEGGEWFADVIFDGEKLICISPVPLEECKIINNLAQ